MDFGGETHAHLLLQQEMKKKKKNRKAEKNTRVKAKTCKTKEGVGGSGAEKKRWEREKKVQRNGGEKRKKKPLFLMRILSAPASALGTLTTFFHLMSPTLKGCFYYPDFQKSEINDSAGEGRI